LETRSVHRLPSEGLLVNMAAFRDATGTVI
jgi:hypothetical protein